MDRLQSLEAFVRVAQTRSFAEAARQLRVSTSVVTTRVKQLEAFLGTPLFHRSTRVVRLSEVGQTFLRDCSELVGRAGSIVDQMRNQRAPVGVLRVHALTGLVLGHFAEFLGSFQNAYPDIQLELTVNDEVIDPVKTGMDCALQIFPPISQELVARTLFPVRRVFCASPRYLATHGAPEQPPDLHAHRLGLYSRYPTRERFTFHPTAADDETVTIRLTPSLLTNSVHLLREYALEGAGIVCVPSLVAGDAIMRGDLCVLLSRWQLSAFPLTAVYAETARKAVKLRLFIEHLSTQFSREPPWDLPLIERGVIPAQAITERAEQGGMSGLPG